MCNYGVFTVTWTYGVWSWVYESPHCKFDLSPILPIVSRTIVSLSTLPGSFRVLLEPCQFFTFLGSYLFPLLRSLSTSHSQPLCTYSTGVRLERFDLTKIDSCPFKRTFKTRPFIVFDYQGQLKKIAHLLTNLT